MTARRPGITFRIRTLVAFVAVAALVLAICKETSLAPVRRWQSAIHDDDNGPRRWDAINLALRGGATGPDTATAVALLSEALSDPSIRVRQTAAAALPRFGAASRTAVPALIQALDDPDYVVRGHAAYALGEIALPGDDPSRTELIAALSRLLDDSQGDNRLRAAHSLAQQGEGATALPILITALGPRHGWRRYLALSGLRFLSGAEARSAVPAIKQMAADSAMTEGGSDLPLKLGRVYAAELLYRFGEDEAALAILDEADRSTDVQLRNEARRIRSSLAPRQPQGDNF